MTADQLIRAIAQGDKAAFAALYRARRRGLIGYAMAVLANDRASAEDAVDEAFLDIWRHAASYSGSGQGDAWVRRLVRNKAIDIVRRGREVLSDDPQAFSGRDATDPITPFDLAASDSDAAWLGSALGCLSPEQREAVWLCYFEDRPLREIAALTDCPENTVKTRLYHARSRLRRALEPSDAA